MQVAQSKTEASKSAAPTVEAELLAALKAMLHRFGGATDKETPAEKQARAAIARATGSAA